MRQPPFPSPKCTRVTPRRTVGNRGIQIHGGMGFTWENDVHLYYRRAKCSETAFGDATFHRERIAAKVIDSAALDASTVTAKTA